MQGPGLRTRGAALPTGAPPGLILAIPPPFMRHRFEPAFWRSFPADEPQPNLAGDIGLAPPPGLQDALAATGDWNGTPRQAVVV